MYCENYKSRLIRVFQKLQAQKSYVKLAIYNEKVFNKVFSLVYLF